MVGAEHSRNNAVAITECAIGESNALHRPWQLSGHLKALPRTLSCRSQLWKAETLAVALGRGGWPFKRPQEALATATVLLHDKHADPPAGPKTPIASRRLAKRRYSFLLQRSKEAGSPGARGTRSWYSSKATRALSETGVSREVRPGRCGRRRDPQPRHHHIHGPAGASKRPLADSVGLLPSAEGQRRSKYHPSRLRSYKNHVAYVRPMARPVASRAPCCWPCQFGESVVSLHSI